MNILHFAARTILRYPMHSDDESGVRVCVNVSIDQHFLQHHNLHDKFQSNAIQFTCAQTHTTNNCRFYKIYIPKMMGQIKAIAVTNKQRPESIGNRANASVVRLCI